MVKYWYSLDGLRAIAVAIVLLAHAGSPYPRSGGIGVEIFFVLSGFLITGILSREFVNTGKINRKRFYMRRLLRLTPCLVACIALYAILYFILYREFRFDVVAICLTYVANYARAIFDYDLNGMGHCWSLAIEEQFYLFWPFVILFLEKTKKNVRHKAVVLTIFAIALYIYRLIASQYYSPARIYYALDTHMDGLVMGSALYYYTTMITGYDRKDQLLKCVSYILLPLSVIGLLILMASYTWKDIEMAQFGYFMASLASCVIITDLAFSPYSLIKRFLEYSVLTYIGKISYGLYLYHLPIYYFVRREYVYLDKPVKLVVMVSMSFIIAIFSYHFYERKFLKFKKNF